MPSKAFINFRDHLMVDVKRLQESHTQLNNQTPGRKMLGHITRSGVFMLCAAWKSYHEELVKEAILIILDNIDDPKNLPRDVRIMIQDNLSVRKDKSILLSMSGGGWRNLYMSFFENELANFHTPKAENLKKLYSQYIGLKDINNCWSIGSGYIDNFVSDRGDIAHKGSMATYIKKPMLDMHIRNIYHAAEENDIFVRTYLAEEFLGGLVPWNYTYSIQGA